MNIHCLATLLVFLLLLAPRAAELGTSLHSDAPGQPPVGLEMSDWQGILAAHEVGRQAFQPLGESGAHALLAPGPIAQQAYLKAGNTGGTSDDQFGLSVAVSGDTVVVGASYEDGGSTGVNGTPDESSANAGAAYVFVRSGTTWMRQAYLKPSAVGTSQAGDQFGISVAVSGDTLVVGAFNEDSGTTGVNSTPNESASGAGAAYVYVRSGTTWTQQAYLKPAAVGNTQAGDQFGKSVAIEGDTVVVGAFSEDSRTTGVNSAPDENASSSGAAYVYVRDGTTWSQQAYLKPAAFGTSQTFDQFGFSVSISGDTVVVGAFGDDSSTTGVNSEPNEESNTSGAAYVFVRNAGAWTQQAYLKPAAVGTTQKDDVFGVSVAVSGDTVVVGAYLEDSSTSGVNSAPDEDASSSGAAYVYVREGTTWTQQAYLKPSAFGTKQTGDQFGFSVAVAGDTAVVGAYGDDSGTTGVNSAANEDARNSGAAWVFVRSAGAWTQQAYLKTFTVGTTQSNDFFGISVAVSGDTVVAGAYMEDSSTTAVDSTPDEAANDSGAACVFTGLGPAIPTPWQSWQLARFGANAHVPSIAGEQADPEGDGGKNLLEYALGTDPNAANATTVRHDMEFVGQDEFLRLLITKNPSATDVRYTVEVNDDLLNPAGWNSVDTVIEEDTLTSLIVRDNIPAGRRYIRLKVTLL